MQINIKFSLEELTQKLKRQVHNKKQSNLFRIGIDPLKTFTMQDRFSVSGISSDWNSQ